jgi:pSer/pThr/pTyr-binding forkhead associated (FHA) protein
VSRRYAEICWNAGVPLVRDLGSTNGAFVNDERIAEARPLRDGDRLRLAADLAAQVRVLGAADAHGPM